MRKLWKKVLSSVLCLAMLLSFLQFGAVNAFGVSASIDYGKNPTPEVDIAVSIPADYPGTLGKLYKILSNSEFLPEL